jgi:LCP family protein required for cell wall assembly
MTDEPTTRRAARLDAERRGPRHGKQRRRRLKAILITALLLVVAVAGAGLGLQWKYNRNIDRFGDPFANIPEASRPDAGPGGSVAYLLVGSDSRISAGDASKWQAGAQRTDAIMLLRVPADRSAAYLVSIPRDAWVDIPGRGQHKVNAAFAFGGPSLLIQTIEQMTDIRVDHVGVVDFQGFVSMTDALGGVEITVPKTGWNSQKFEAGTQRMDGKTALAYVRQRKNLPGGDLDRVKRQQNWMRAVMSEALSKGTVTNPVKLNSFLEAATNSMAVDEAWSIGEMRSMAIGMRDVRAGDVKFLTAPVQGLGRSADGQSIVLLDDEVCASLWKALGSDDMEGWLADHQDRLLGERVS